MVGPSREQEAKAQQYAENCQCPVCQPEKFADLPTGRIDNRHGAVRFGDWPKGLILHVYLDGEEVQKCFEFYTGENGWVRFYPTDPSHFGGDEPAVHICQRCLASGRMREQNAGWVCQDVRYGEVHTVPDGAMVVAV